MANLRHLLWAIFAVATCDGQLNFNLPSLFSRLSKTQQSPSPNLLESATTLAPTTTSQPSISCSDSDTHFELVTGYVFTSPDDMLDSRPGTLMLTDCIDLCRRNSTCKSANFETGLCVLFGSSAEEFPGGLTSSQYPVFTLYIQKLCLSGTPRCERAWTFERVRGYGLDKYAKKRGKVTSRENCEAQCISEKEFICRSATYNSVTGDCRTSDMDRHTVSGIGGAFVESLDDEYLENNCADDPVKLCDFQLLENKIMKTVDSVYQDVPTNEACRDLCLSAPYRCHSFDYGDTGERVCRLSHHTSTTLTQIQEPFLVIDDVVGTYELSACYNVTIDCRASDMIATVRTNKLFNGKIYAKDNPNSCVVDVDNKIEFTIKMGYSDIECNVKRKSQGFYSNEVIIQHHDSIVTSADLGLALNCQYDLSNRTILNDFDLAIEGEIESSLFEESRVDSPNVIMKITERGGADLSSAKVGDPLELHFEILDLESPYEIFVRDLVAKDGNDQNEISLLDSRGCPSEGQIMGPLLKSKQTSKILLSKFDAFKFPSSDVVQFRALVTPCMPTCEPVDCSYRDYYGGDNTRISSYGRKKRDLSGYEIESHPEAGELLVTQAFVVTDKFGKRGSPTALTKTTSQAPSSPSSTFNENSGHSTTPNWQDFSPKDTPYQSASDVSRPNDRKTFYNFDEEYKNPVKNVHSLTGVDVEVTEVPNKKLKSSSESSDDHELCLNTTGITVAVAMFIIIQLIIAFAWNHLWQRKKKTCREKEEIIKKMFNPYSTRN